MRLQFYSVDAKYCQYLRTYDPCVPNIEMEKESRPFIGIVIQVDNHSFYAPLTSPKPKHLNMKNQIDFIKINEGLWGAINLNNMIPVHASQVKLNYIGTNLVDNKEEKAYKGLLNNQLDWCNQNKNMILKKAKRLYSMIVNDDAPAILKNRCCNFENDIQLLEQYAKIENAG